MPITSLTRPLTHRLTHAITQAGAGGAWTPAQWFLASEQGIWLDPSDFSTMFQDSAGTTPVTAVEQPVGLMLDKRLGLVRGAEQAATPYTVTGTGWSATTNSVTRVLTGVAATCTVTSVSSPEAGKLYVLSFTASALSGQTCFFNYGANTTLSAFQRRIATAGDYSFLVQAASTAGFICAAYEGGDFALTVTNISVREIPGNHASQATTAQEPVLKESGAYSYLNLDRVDDNMTAAAGGGGTTGIIVCAAIRAGGAGNARTIWSDRGTNTGYRLSVNASNQLVLSAGNGSAHTEVVGPTITAGTDYVVTGWHDGTNLNVRVNAGATTSAAFGTATAGTAGFTIGEDNGAATGYYGERIYEIVYRKNDASTAGDRTSLITYMAAQAGISL